MSVNENIIEHSKLNMVSYGLGFTGRQILQLAFNIFVFFYYETEIGLNVWLIGLGLVIFALFNAVNDPIIGYLTNRPFKFTKKWGRRLPWILIGGIPFGFSYFLVFNPPRVDPQQDAWILFGWLVFTTCLFDTLHSIFYVNLQSVFPDKFRSKNERRSATVFQILLSVVGTAIGSILPPLFITFGDLSSYTFQALIVMMIATITVILGIPGFREDQETIDRYLKSADKEEKRESFVISAKKAFKQQSFTSFIFIYTMYFVVINSVTASLPYVIRYTLKLEAVGTTFVMAGFLLGVIISMPFWIKFAKKTNDNRKAMLIAAILMGVFLIPFLFFQNYYLLILLVFIFGTAQGGFWSMIFPVFSDVIDESVVLQGKREEGTYTGIQQFFGRLGLVIQVMSFAIIHSLTGFVEGAGPEAQPELALVGIRLHLALVPMIAILMGAFIFWKWYDLRPEKVDENQLKIKELKL